MVQYPAQSPYYAQEAMQRLMLSAQENGGHSYQLPQIVLATSLYLKNLPPEVRRTSTCQVAARPQYPGTESVILKRLILPRIA